MMRTNDGRIDHLQRGVGHPASGERFQHHVPDAAVGPPPKLAKDRVPVAEFLRQVAPRRARSHHPKHGVEHAAMVPCRPPAMMDQERFETRPLIIAHQSANQDRSPQRAALNQLAIPSSMGLSTRPSLSLHRYVRIAFWRWTTAIAGATAAQSACRSPLLTRTNIRSIDATFVGYGSLRSKNVGGCTVHLRLTVDEE